MNVSLITVHSLLTVSIILVVLMRHVMVTVVAQDVKMEMILFFDNYQDHYAKWLGGTVDIKTASFKICFKNGDKYCWTKAVYGVNDKANEPCAPNGAYIKDFWGDPDSTIDANHAGWVIQTLGNAARCADHAYWNVGDTNGACQDVHLEPEKYFHNVDVY